MLTRLYYRETLPPVTEPPTAMEGGIFKGLKLQTPTI